MDLTQIRHIATLAALSLTDEEEHRLADDLTRIVAYVEELEAVDTSGVAPTPHAIDGAPLPLRADVQVPGLSHEDALAQAPRAEHGGFAVPTFVE